MMPSSNPGVNITDLCSRLADNTAIDPNLYEKLKNIYRIFQ